MASRTIANVGVVAAVSMLLAACSMSPAPDVKTKEFFSVKEFGAASPKRVSQGRPVPKGGGRYQVGKAYRVAGKTYVPKDNPAYSKIGYASWYGDAFHGRQTANGEIYDMHDLTAAHPTLPLPSYVRVTNLENKRSVVVRVNDRGPFSDNRIIDVSKAVAGMLDFEKRGVAKVKVDYVGRADLGGRDRNMLMASYSDPSKPSSNDLFSISKPLLQLEQTPQPRLKTAYASDLTLQPVSANNEPLDLVPSYSLRPGGNQDLLAPLIMNSGRITSFRPVALPDPAHAAVAAMASGGQGLSTPEAHVVQLGTFANPSNAQRISEKFSRFGHVEILVRPRSDKAPLRLVRVAVQSRASAQMVIKTAHDVGLSGAYVVSQ